MGPTVQPETHEDVVTIMFTDVEGSTHLTTRHGAETARRLIDLQRAVIREQVERAGGTVRDVIGDGFMITFPSTRRAVSCALDIQRRLAEHARERPGEVVRVRIGLHVGEILQEESGHPFGAAVNAAARVVGKARGGQVLLSDTVRQLAGRLPGVGFHDRGRVELKGFPERWRLYEAVAEIAPPPRRVRVPAVPARIWVLAGAAGVVLAALVGVLALAGDGDDRSNASVTPPPAPARAIDDAALILPGRSIGDARLGMTEAELIDMYGGPELTRDWKAPGKVGVALNYTLHDWPFRVYLFDGKVIAIGTQSDYYETEDGIRVGYVAPLPGDTDKVSRSGRQYVWRNYFYRGLALGCSFWYQTGFGAVTELIFAGGQTGRLAGIRIARAEFADEAPRELGRCLT